MLIWDFPNCLELALDLSTFAAERSPTLAPSSLPFGKALQITIIGFLICSRLRYFVVYVDKYIRFKDSQQIAAGRAACCAKQYHKGVENDNGIGAMHNLCSCRDMMQPRLICMMSIINVTQATQYIPTSPIQNFE